MRISPLGIFGAFCTVDNVFSSAVEDAKLTHPNEVCQHSSALFACTIAHAIASGEARDSIYRFAVELAAHRKLNDSVISAIRAAESAPPASFTSQQGWVLIALQNAFYQLLHAPTLEAGVIDTVMHGGDTDTNAAIAGALLGAVHGRDTIPQQWRRSILTCRPMHGLIDSAIVHPRPSCFWPVDAMELAERLLWVGSQK